MTELIIERLFDAPRDVVYQAFVDPDQLAHWFGPPGFACPRDTIDVDASEGGHWRMTMVNGADPDQASPVKATFDEVIENELLLGHEDFTAELAATLGAPRMSLRLEFHDRGEQTLLRMVQGPYDEKFAPMARAGWNGSFTKLDNLFLVRLGLLPEDCLADQLAG